MLSISALAFVAGQEAVDSESSEASDSSLSDDFKLKIGEVPE